MWKIGNRRKGEPKQIRPRSPFPLPSRVAQQENLRWHRTREKTEDKVNCMHACSRFTKQIVEGELNNRVSPWRRDRTRLGNALRSDPDRNPAGRSICVLVLTQSLPILINYKVSSIAPHPICPTIICRIIVLTHNHFPIHSRELVCYRTRSTCQIVAHVGKKNKLSYYISSSSMQDSIIQINYVTD